MIRKEGSRWKVVAESGRPLGEYPSKGEAEKRLSKRCSSCGEVKAHTEFARNRARKSGLQCHCKKCFRERFSNYSPERRRKRHIERYYNIPWDEYLQLIESQDYKCAICFSPIESLAHARTTTAHVDHDHVTGKVRALLCHFCNSGLGYFRDEIRLMKAAVVYLETHQGNNAAKWSVRKIKAKKPPRPPKKGGKRVT